MQFVLRKIGVFYNKLMVMYQ